jgi:hypothetical protein
MITTSGVYSPEGVRGVENSVAMALLPRAVRLQFPN